MEKTAAAYARYSTDNQTENSIAYQMHEITGYCAKNNIRLTHSFIDEGESGTNINRDGFQDMIAAAQAKEFNTIIIYDVSRGSRDIADWFTFRKQMRELGITVISCHQQLGDPLNPDDFLREFITVGLGQHMVLETRQKSMDGMSAAAREGKFLGGKPPYGYAVENQRYVIIPSEAAFVRKVYDLYYRGYSYNYIMDKLHVAGVVGRKGKPMNKNSLYYMLKNPRYAGVYIWNEYTYQCMRRYVGRKPNPRAVRVDGAIPAIVDTEVWAAVQNRLEHNKHQNRKISSSARRVALLAGLIECGSCGTKYVSYTVTSRGHEYHYYACGKRYKNGNKPDACPSLPVRGDKLEPIVIDAVKKCLTAQTDFRALAEHIAEEYYKASDTVDVSAEKNELVSIDAQINNGVNAILSGLDTPELRAKINELKERKRTLEDAIAQAGTQTRKINVDALEERLRSNVENLDSADPENVKVAIQRHVPYIIAEKDGTFTVAVGYVLNDFPPRKGAAMRTTARVNSSAGFEEYVVDNVGAEVAKLNKIKGSLKTETTRAVTGTERVVDWLAGAVGLEPTTNGFGDHYSTN